MKRPNGELICIDVEAFALGALDPGEAQAFAQHLESGCANCAAALERYGAVVEMLAHAPRPVAVPASVASEVLAKIGGEARPGVEGQRFVRRDERGWVESGFDGIEIRVLSDDREGGRRTFMVRMRDGAGIPRHRHAGFEEIFVLEGHLSLSGVEMHSGDYCRAEGGTIHDIAVSRGGCVFLVNGSTGDRVLANE